MNIRALKEADILRCLEIYGYYVENTCFTLEEETPSPADFAKRCLSIAGRYPFIVIENDAETVVGYAYLDTFNPRSAYRITADLSVYVSSDRLHEHIGGMLLRGIEARAAAYGIKNIVSIITDENENSLSFHLNNGFVTEGHIRDTAVKFGKVLGVYYPRKALAPSV